MAYRIFHKPWDTCKFLSNNTCSESSQKHVYIMLTPLNPHFYIVKLGFTGVYIIFLIFARKHRLLEPPRRGGSNEYHTLCFEQKYEKYRAFIWFLSLLATASRLYAIAWGFLLRHKRIFITAIFIRALLLNQTQCGTITANWMWSRGIFYSFSISLT